MANLLLSFNQANFIPCSVLVLFNELSLCTFDNAKRMLWIIKERSAFVLKAAIARA
jgi:hypothetical protein